ncbi:MAG: hypothetical protein ABF755_08185 [Oenococcus oeni]
MMLLLFVSAAFIVLRQFPNFVKQREIDIFVPNTKANTDLDLFIWLTLLVFGLRYVRFFANFFGIVILLFVTQDLLLF